jgi:ABC-type nitrate/sulfonate/bicarbonate transport system substrate-binding protein
MVANMNIGKKKWLAATLPGVLMTLVVMSGCLGAAKGDVNYGGQYYPGEFVLQGKNFWEEYDLDVEHTLFSSGSENNQALISGDMDINCGSDSKTVSLFTAIPDEAVIIGTLQKGNRYSTIVDKDSDYQSWEDLKGKTVATRMGTGAEQVLLRYFELNETLDWDDFNWVNLNIEDMASSLESGTIEAFTAWEPTPAIAEAQGIGKLMRTYGDIALVPVSIHTTKSYAEDHREEIVKFLAAQIDKAELIQNDPEQAAQIAADAASEKGYEVSAEAFETVFERIDFSIDFDENVLASINDTANFLYEQGKIDSIPTIRWDKSFLQEAQDLRNNA